MHPSKVDVTSKKTVKVLEAEVQRLQHKNEKYRTMLENLNEVLYSMDAEGRITYVSPAVKTILGYTPAEVVGSHFLDMVHPEDVAPIKQGLESLSKGQLKQTEYRIQAKPGYFCWVRTSSRPFLTDGCFSGLHGVLTDITALKKIESALHKSETLHREAQKVAHLGHWELIPSIGVPTWSEEIFHIFGLDTEKGEPSFLAHQDLIHPEDWDLLNESVTRATQGGTSFDIDIRLIRPKGDIRWMNAKGRSEKDTGGNVTRLFGTAQDITRFKVVETALGESEEKFRNIVNNLNVGVYRNTPGPHGKFIEVNPALVKMFGYDNRETFMSRHVSDFYKNPEERAAFSDKIKKHGMVRNEEIRLKKMDGTPLIGSVSGVAIKNHSGEVKYFDTVIEDITERKRLEADLNQARKMEAIATLSGGLAHDYNNLLSIIVGNLELAMQEVDPGSDLLNFLNKINDAAIKCRDLTHKLMALSKGGAPVKEVGSLRMLLKRVGHMLPPGSGISLKESVPNDLSPVFHDPRKLDIVFRNVLNNAIEAMPDGGTLSISAENLRVDDGSQEVDHCLKRGDYVKISFMDQGRGIPEDHLEKIFDPYFSTKDMGVQKGMGLGLATAYAIVQKHEGSILVKSIPGKGTTVSMYLPAATVIDKSHDIKRHELP